MATYVAQDDAIINLDDTAGSPADISDHVSACQFDIEVNIGSFAVLGDRWMQKTEGTSNGKGTLTLRTSIDSGGGHHIVTHWLLNNTTNKAAQKTLQIQDPDAAVGSYQFDMEVLPASYNEVVKSAGEPNPGEHQLAFEIVGAPTWTIIT